MPRYFRSALEAAINDEAQPIEERLRTQLVDMIRECQDRVFSSYRSRTAALSPLPTNNGALSSPESQEPEQPHEQNLGTRSEDMLGNFYQEPPRQTDEQPIPVALRLVTQGRPQTFSDDSGYASTTTPISQNPTPSDDSLTNNFPTHESTEPPIPGFPDYSQYNTGLNGISQDQDIMFDEINFDMIGDDITWPAQN